MSEQDRLVNRIPAEQLENVVSWILPQVQPKGEPILSSQRAAKNAENEGQIAPKSEDETVEELDVEESPQLTAEELARISEEARQEGFDAGYKEGREKGEKEGLASGLKSGETKAFKQTLAKRNDEFKRLKSITDTLFQPMEAQQAQLEDILVEMAVALAKQLMVQEIQQNPTALYNIVNHALSALPAGGKSVCVHLNAEDVELLQEAVPSSSWQIQEDSSISRGGCKVSTDVSLVDFTVEPRISTYLEEIRLRGEIDAAALPEVEVYRTDNEPTERQSLSESEEKTSSHEAEQARDTAVAVEEKETKPDDKPAVDKGDE